MVGYYYEFSNKTKFGLCLFTDRYPGLRRACTLDWAAGVMGMMLGVSVIIAECAANFINQRDWNILFYITKLCSAGVVIALSLAGSIQGITEYHDYCVETKYCKFSDRSNSEDIQHKISVDFIIVIALSATNMVWWVSTSSTAFVYITSYICDYSIRVYVYIYFCRFCCLLLSVFDFAWNVVTCNHLHMYE